MEKENYIKKNFNIQEFYTLIDDYSAFIIERINEINSNKINQEYQIFIDLLIRFNVNIKGVKLMLPCLISNIEFKIPISLLLRSINSDVLTTFYLHSFILPNHNNNALINEIKIHQKDYVRFIKEFSKEELYLIKEIYPDWKEYIKKIEITIENHYNDYSEFYVKKNDEYKLISNKMLRKNTPEYFFPNINLSTKPNTFMTEKYKYERLKMVNKTKFCGQAFLLFKYYSQFQHISPATTELINIEPNIIDYKFLIISLENIFISSNYILKTVTNNGYKKTIHNFQNRLINLNYK